MGTLRTEPLGTLFPWLPQQAGRLTTVLVQMALGSQPPLFPSLHSSTSMQTWEKCGGQDVSSQGGGGGEGLPRFLPPITLHSFWLGVQACQYICKHISENPSLVCKPKGRTFPLTPSCLSRERGTVGNAWLSGLILVSSAGLANRSSLSSGAWEQLW